MTRPGVNHPQCEILMYANVSNSFPFLTGVAFLHCPQIHQTFPFREWGKIFSRKRKSENRICKINALFKVPQDTCIRMLVWFCLHSSHARGLEWEERKEKIKITLNCRSLPAPSLRKDWKEEAIASMLSHNTRCNKSKSVSFWNVPYFIISRKIFHPKFCFAWESKLRSYHYK
jgi:hypothetical protein